jgi:phosphonate metabolism protein PhnN/1,5-bisphosphokinase (PRPP-forming)
MPRFHTPSRLCPERTATTMPRYALYYAPRKTCPWHTFGAAWLGRCAFDDKEVAQVRIDGVEPLLLSSLTEAPRRYGFHATLKAPFRLAEDTSLADLSDAVDRFCATQAAIELAQPKVVRMGQFAALAWPDQRDQITSVANECVVRFDDYRAPLVTSEIERRRTAGLTSRGEELLMRWGYPHVLDQFRFHMSLTGPLGTAPAMVIRRIHDAAEQGVSSLAGTPFMFDAISIFEEPIANAPFRVVHRSVFGGGSGRLLYVVGPSGVGKDSLLDYARANLPGASHVRFARRTITRPAALGGEEHIAVSDAQFVALEETHRFCMTWQANNHRYGIGREVLTWLAEGATVVVNGSRAHVMAAAERFPQLELVEISAPAEVLAQRLRKRAREDDGAIESRMQRLDLGWQASSAQRHRIVNSGALADAGNAFVALITGQPERI